ncbi:hypothetical protein Pd630_LPD13113 (plasmid) [Rhodococcus opacus PD630]|nr:hypothetical protein Pd630_LPD13113 [Rhodococcus opacus PD630]
MMHITHAAVVFVLFSREGTGEISSNPDVDVRIRTLPDVG